MAAFNVSVHNSSPLISYTAAWLDTPAGDAFAVNYTDSGFHTTSDPGATAIFTFNGTGVWLYGAHRPGYGSYTLSVDGSTVFNGSAASSNPVFDQVLGGSANLSMGEHTAVLTNIGGGAVDLDSLVFETQIGANDQQVSQMTVDDSNSTISYLALSQWQTASNSFFANGTSHYSNTDGANATLTFSGEAVAVYGGVSFDHGMYTVSVDGQTQQLNGANGQARVYHPKSLLYFASNLGNGTHNLTMSVGNGYFDLDQVVVYKATGGKEGSEDASSGGMEMKPGDLHINAANGNNAAGAAVQSKSLSPAVIAVPPPPCQEAGRSVL
ncbi:hypothetical protein PHLGIDRAFT_186302 [Phlebiopsis gigantea 11061_1 CR5-6]|uniref:Uncharacterized protein n=1 Tax=Phlebiopsis gigantea (strain 11061_1 CR5-6) TaxID=745531 RepID=A0A0C3SEU3_PHLG1|nr:hypothetical protein PHLGIDRAFT_186302 [Phlebiopsis gigantea 11061_1 CR5-6]